MGEESPRAVIAPRQTRLVRTPDLRAFQRAIVELAIEGSPASRRSRVVLVPTRAAADQARRTIELHTVGAPGNGPAACILPDLFTRGEWYARLAECLPGPPPILTDLEREVLVTRAARAAETEGLEAPFAMRAGLATAILAFYDELKRRQRTVEAFERLLTSSLEPSAETDRGAARLLVETRFLAEVFRRYETALAADGLHDEHQVRARLLAESRPSPYRHVVVTMADEVVDRHGLWPADFDLLTRLPGLDRLDVVATEELLAAGFAERVHEHLPGIEEVRVKAGGGERPVLLTPPEPDGPLYHTARDREDELVAAVRRAKSVARTLGPGALDRMAVVFDRPLPYVYLARPICRSAGVPLQMVDALPLAAEPYAAMLDLVFTVVLTGYTRESLAALVACPLLRFTTEDGRAVGRREASALGRALLALRFLGGREALVRVAAVLDEGDVPDLADDVRRAAARAARALVPAADLLSPLETEAPPSAHLRVLGAFLDRYERRPGAGVAFDERHARARAAILGAVDALASACVRYDDTPRTFASVAASLRRWIESQTFAPRTGEAGLTFLDAVAARYGDFDEVRLVGLSDTDWPASTPRPVFYPAGLLTQLGWPVDADRRRGPRAAFRDLLRLPRARVSVSTFALEDDALVRPSPFLEDLGDLDLPLVREPVAPAARIFTHEALAREPVVADAVSGAAAAWLALRVRRRPTVETDPSLVRTPPRGPEPYRVTAVERYLQCPFQYFAAHVLQLEEERDEEASLTPQERGRVLHDVLRTFLETWRASGRGPLTPETVDEALAEFARAADAHLSRLPEADAALERARLLGSVAAPGAIERLVAVELDSAPPVEQLLEYTLDGEFEFPAPTGPRRLHVRGKADRIDLLPDGTLRVIDYKLGSAPAQDLAVQLPVYGVAAEQQLGRTRGGRWRFAGAGYVAFGGPRGFVPLASPRVPFDEAVRRGVERFVRAVDGIAAGAFPVRPAQPFRCGFCPYPSVCRKDGVGDE